ncbi:hypothetical protein D8674_022094 [Pyrus ussuriensis x Pyrus communis]|uniref:Uncharacterized protein n=1 Tax=Pyrus ussuriensis x Pyrus communis TaxID=2448454 RepID=A0A5N5GIZ0_9ROSA|nr:hypothetical protein D8674_022094 [Pyrus ussuriensis x Pyrus communis]
MADKNKDESVNVKKVVMDELLLMKLMDGALEGGYNRWHYEVLPNGTGPSK